MAILEPFPHYPFFQYSPTIPAIMWNINSPEQAFHQLGCEYSKLIAFTDSMVDTLNSQYQIVNNLQSQLPTLVENDVKDYLDTNLADSSSVLYDLVNSTVTQWADDRTAQVDAIQAYIDSITVGTTYEDIHDYGFLYIQSI